MGPYKQYHDNGNIYIDGTKDGHGSFIGVYKEYYVNGQIKIEGTQLGRRRGFYGAYTEYCPDGRIKDCGVKNSKGDLIPDRGVAQQNAAVLAEFVGKKPSLIQSAKTKVLGSKFLDGLFGKKQR